MINRVANKNVDTIVIRQTGETAKVKFLNFLASGMKLLRMDQQAVSTPDTILESGDIITDHAGVKYTLVDITPEFFRTAHIRNFITLVTANNEVTVVRAIPVSNLQGGIKGHTDTVIHLSIPCKVGTVSSLQNKALDVNIERFVLLLSKHYPVLIGDTIKFAEHYETAKVEGIKYDLEGIQEIFFDKDPRWISV